MRCLMSFVLLLALAGSAWAQDGGRALDDVRILSADDMQGRRTDTEGSARARAYILQRFAQIGVKPAGAAFEQAFTAAGNRKGVNLVGMIDGTDPAGKVLVVTAHYDHLGVRNGQVYNGADDNASGVAGLLAVAEAFAKDRPRHTVIFAVLDDEESGLTGARYLVANPPVPLPRIALAVNFDMLSKNAKSELWVAGATHFPYLRPRLEALAAKAPVTLNVGHDTPVPARIDDWTNQSDHYAFHEKRVPWLYFGVEDHPEYHKPTDDFATIPQDFFHRSVRTVIAATKAMEADLDAIARDGGR